VRSRLHFLVKGMTTTHDKDKTPRRREHLTPLEIQAIADARARGTKVSDLAMQYRVSRQTIYNAVRETKRTTESAANGQLSNQLAIKRPRTKRITPEIEAAVADMKRKYPAWGVDYLRRQWEKSGNASLSRTTISRILRDAGLNTRRLVENETYQRFEMKKPGQLWQMDIQGKIYLPGLGWVYGFAILDDFSRFSPAFQYFLDEKLSNGILTLDRAIAKYGVPEAIYVDHGKQFRSDGERLNNFELFCAAHGIKVISSTVGRPEGKGKIERFYETEENQFITFVRAKLKEDPNYSLAQLNRDLEAYLQDDYHAHVHSVTKETPAARFAQSHLRIPLPPIDVTKYLERTMSRRVNKFGEISFGGYKIQVSLPSRTRVIVVETIETIRIEHGGVVCRQVNKRDLNKEPVVKRQDGVLEHEDLQSTALENDNAGNRKVHHKREHHTHRPDDDGYFHRRINTGGNIKVQGISYYVGQVFAGKDVLIKIVGNILVVSDENHDVLVNIEISRGRKY
jgi:putative transposase